MESSRSHSNVIFSCPVFLSVVLYAFAVNGGRSGIWGWNGKAHQIVGLPKRNEFQDWVVDMRFLHSGYYVLGKDGDVVQDDIPADRPNSALWRILKEGEAVPTDLPQQANEASWSVWSENGKIYLSAAKGGLAKVMDLTGKTVVEGEVRKVFSSEISLPTGLYFVHFNGEVKRVLVF